MIQVADLENKMEFIPHSKPTVGRAEADAVAGVIRSGMLAQGRRVAEFERRFSRRFDLGKTVAVGSGTAALHLSLLALGIGPGDEVIIPSFVCTALLNAVRYVGATPNVADININTLNIDPLDAERRINEKTKAIIVPHMFGLAADLAPLLETGLPVIEDCAQAVGAKYRGEPVGSLGTLSVFSFYATKVMTTGEGGMVASKDRSLIEKIRDMRAYDNRDEYSLRFNYKMTDMQASMGIIQLEKLGGFLERRKAIAATYTEILKKAGNRQMVLPVETKDHTYFRYVVRIDRNIDKLCEKLRDCNFGVARPVFKPIHRYLGQKGLIKADQAWNTALSLPVYPALQEREAERMAETLNGILE